MRYPDKKRTYKMTKKDLLEKTEYKFQDLLAIIEILRAPDGCPWDREQTHQSIRRELIEESYEVIEGIDSDNPEIMCEELGDLLLQIVFHASIAKDAGRFDIDSICDGICKKLIYRHPHVFSDVVAETSEKVLENWDELKKKEKKQKDTADVLNSVSHALPSLMRGQKLVKKSGIETDFDKSCENIGLIVGELKNAEGNAAGEVLGRLLFECCKLGQCKKVDLEQALYLQNDVFCAENQKN